jgi:hypothetical protein
VNGATRHTGVRAQSWLSWTSIGKYAQAQAFDSQSLEIMRRVLGPEHRNTLLSMNNLAAVYDDQEPRPNLANERGDLTL